VKKKRIILRTFLWPGWGHLAAGKRKKGWFLWWVSLVSLLIIVCGMTILVLRLYAAPAGEEVQIDQTGIVIEEEMLQNEEEAEGEEESPFAPLILPLTIIVIGLAIRSCGGVLAYKDIKRLSKEK